MSMSDEAFLKGVRDAIAKLEPSMTIWELRRYMDKRFDILERKIDQTAQLCAPSTKPEPLFVARPLEPRDAD